MLERLSINLTHICNLDCTYCYALGGDYGGFAGDAKYAAVRDKIRDVVLLHPEIHSVQFFGGEPLLRFDMVEGFVAEIEALHRDGLLRDAPSYSVVSNLTMLDEARLATMQRYGMNVVVSLDGPPEVNDVTRPYKGGRGSTARVLENIDRLRQAQVAFDIECTFSKAHWRLGYDVATIFHYLAALGPNVVKMTNVSHPDPEIGFAGREDVQRLHDEHFALLDTALDALIEEGRVLPYGYLMELMSALSSNAAEGAGCCGEPGAYCNAGTGNMAISADAKVYPCHMFTANRAFEMEVHEGEVTHAPKMVSKADHAGCRSCWASKWCLACPGAMEFRTPGQGGPSAVHCGLMRGGLERVFARLDRVAA